MQTAALSARVLLTGALAGLAACAGQGKDAASPRAPTYLGAEIEPLGDDLVAFRVRLKGPRDRAAVEDYARCTAAGHVQKQGGGFLRHLRTNTDEEGGIWRADAVYSVSSALPKGLQTIDAEVTVDDCALRGIPTRD